MMVDNGHRPQEKPACGQMIARAQSAVDKHCGRLRILGQAIDDSQRRTQEFDEGADSQPERSPAFLPYEFDGPIEVLFQMVDANPIRPRWRQDRDCRA